MKNRITIICLTAVSIAECYYAKELSGSTGLWCMYGIYKVFHGGIIEIGK